MKKLQLSLSPKFIMFLCLFVVLSYFSPIVSNAEDGLTEEQRRLLEVYDYLKNYHLNGTPEEKIATGAIYGMIWSTEDPYTDYFTDEEFDEFIQGIEMQYKVIGVYLEDREDGIYVSGVIEDSPAKKAGVQIGDKIISVDDIDLEGYTAQETTELITSSDQSLTIVINRDGKNLTFKLTKETLQLPDITSELLPDKIGYIKLYTFSTTIHLEFEKAIMELKDKGAKKFILDLRGNPGGFMDAAVNLSHQLIDEGTIVGVENRNGEKTVYEAKNGSKWTDPLVLLVDNNTASAAELVTAVVKDYKLGTIIGTNTYGKGTIQQLIELEYGGVLKLTANQYFSPKGKKIHGIGIKPDIVVTAVNAPLEYAKRYFSNGAQMTIDAAGKLYQGKSALNQNAYLHSDHLRYVPVKTLLNIFGGELAWNPEDRTVSYALGGATRTWGLNDTKSDLLVVNGVSYLPVQKLNKIFPALQKVDENGSVTLTLR